MYEISPYATFSITGNNSRSVTTSTLDYTMQFKTFGHTDDHESNVMVCEKSSGNKCSWPKHRYCNSSDGKWVRRCTRVHARVRTYVLQKSSVRLLVSFIFITYFKYYIWSDVYYNEFIKQEAYNATPGLETTGRTPHREIRTLKIAAEAVATIVRINPTTEYPWKHSEVRKPKRNLAETTSNKDVFRLFSKGFEYRIQRWISSYRETSDVTTRRRRRTKDSSASREYNQIAEVRIQYEQIKMAGTYSSQPILPLYSPRSVSWQMGIVLFCAKDGIGWVC